MVQILNLTYRIMAEGRNKIEMAKLQEDLAPPEEKEKMAAKRNMEAMKSLPGGLLVPPPRKK